MNQQPSLDDFAFHVEQWDDRDMRVDAILAVATNSTIAMAAYAAALKLRDRNIIRVRHRARVLDERFPDGLPRRG